MFVHTGGPILVDISHLIVFDQRDKEPECYLF
jgi:hypothetical protein